MYTFSDAREFRRLFPLITWANEQRYAAQDVGQPLTEYRLRPDDYLRLIDEAKRLCGVFNQWAWPQTLYGIPITIDPESARWVEQE